MNHQDTVREERAKYGTPLGYENAWKTINAVCIRHAGEGWGLIDKPTGTNWQGYSVDVIMNRVTGEAVDCLGDAEGLGIPAWNVLSGDAVPSASRWRPPVGVVPPGPTDPEPDTLEARVEALEASMAELKATLRSV